MWHYTWYKNKFLFGPLTTSTFFIHHLMIYTILTQYLNVMDQINTFERVGTKLTYSVKVRDQILSLPNI